MNDNRDLLWGIFILLGFTLLFISYILGDIKSALDVIAGV